MAKDLSDTVRDMLGDIVNDAVKSVGDATSDKQTMAGARGLAAGAGLAALAPLAKKGFDAVRSNGVPSVSPGKVADKVSPANVADKVNPGKVAGRAASKVGDTVGNKLKEGVSEKVDQAGGAGGIAKQAIGGLGGVLPGGGGDDGGSGKEGMEGVGQGRRMPVQQSVDVAVPLETAYNQWTQFEDWPEFMQRVTRVTQEDDCTVSFATKIWGKTKEFVAEIETQRPDERIKWRVSQGITHTGVVTFHELAPRLTRIELNVDVDPGSLIEKFARGARHIKRAMRADLHRYKAFIEMQEIETGAWRGVIEEGELVEEHDESYDEKRQYSDAQELEYGSEDGAGEDEDQEEEEQEERPRARSTQRAKSQSRSASSGGRSKSGSTKSKSSSSGRSRSSRSRGSSNGSKASSSGTRASSSGASSKRSSSKSGSSRSKSGGSKRKSSSRSS
jgi:uncharacterized membrane protein